MGNDSNTEIIKVVLQVNQIEKNLSHLSQKDGLQKIISSFIQKKGGFIQ